jgi:hypothetical protein
LLSYDHSFWFQAEEAAWKWERSRLKWRIRGQGCWWSLPLMKLLVSELYFTCLNGPDMQSCSFYIRVVHVPKMLFLVTIRREIARQRSDQGLNSDPCIRECIVLSRDYQSHKLCYIQSMFNQGWLLLANDSPRSTSCVWPVNALSPAILCFRATELERVRHQLQPSFLLLCCRLHGPSASVCWGG